MIPKDPKVSKNDLTSHGTSMNNLSFLFVCIWQLGRTYCSMPRAILDCWTPIIFLLSLRGQMLQRIANKRPLLVPQNPDDVWFLKPALFWSSESNVELLNKQKPLNKKNNCGGFFHLTKMANSRDLNWLFKRWKKSQSHRTTPSVIAKILGVILLCKSTARCQAHAAQRPEKWQNVYNLGNGKRDVKQGGPRKSSSISQGEIINSTYRSHVH